MFLTIMVRGLRYPLMWTDDDMLVRRIGFWQKLCNKQQKDRRNTHSFWQSHLYRLAFGITLMATGFSLSLTVESWVRIVTVLIMGFGVILTFTMPVEPEQRLDSHRHLMKLVHEGLSSGALIDVSAVKGLGNTEMQKLAIRETLDFERLIYCPKSGLRDSQIELYACFDEEKRLIAEGRLSRAASEIDDWLEQVNALA